MSGYISRRLLLDLIDELGSCGAEPDTWARGYNDAIDEVYKVVIRTPAADVAPVKHAHWITCEDYYGSYEKCSLCGDEFSEIEADCAQTNYCPNCGLIMTDSGKIALIKQMMCDFWGYRSDEIRAAEFSVLVEMISTVLDFRGADNGVQ